MSVKLLFHFQLCCDRLRLGWGQNKRSKFFMGIKIEGLLFNVSVFILYKSYGIHVQVNLIYSFAIYKYMYKNGNVFCRWPVAYFGSNPATAHQLYTTFWECVDVLCERGFTIDYVMLDGAELSLACSSMVILLKVTGNSMIFLTDITRSVLSKTLCIA